MTGGVGVAFPVLSGWLLKDLHYQQLYSELHSLEVWAFFLQFAVVHIHRVELILFIGTQFVPWLWVVLSVPADIWIKQCQAHHIQCCSSTPCSNKYEERNQLETNRQRRVAIITSLDLVQIRAHWFLSI